MKNMLVASLVVIVLASLSCRQEEAESPTKGTLRLTVPESIAPVMRAEVDAFMHLYAANGADIRYDIGTTEQAARAFILDTPRVAFLTRRLTESEQRSVRERCGDLLEVAVAQDGIAVVVHHANRIDQISVNELRRLLNGSLTHWERLSGHRSQRGRIAVYLQDSSDVSRYLQGRLLKGGAIAATIQRTSSSVQTLESVASRPLGIGFVGLDWIDSVKASIVVLPVSQSAADVDTSFHPPTQSIGSPIAPIPAYVYRGDYPLKRILYMYTKAVRTDLATGFSTFVAGNEGQRLFLSHNLVPGTRPIRLRSSTGIPE